MIEIYTDGSSRGNPGPGGWGLVVMSENRILLAIGKEHKDDITNNRMELSALVLALELASKTFPTEWTTIYSDSAYCVNICNE
jgi:ribonuclease HI